MRLEGFGISVTIPAGWNGRLFDRFDAEPEFLTNPTLQAGSFTLPSDDGTFGQAAIRRMRVGDVFVVLYEAGGPEIANVGQYSATSLPRSIRADELQPRAAPAPVDGVNGKQWFMTKAGRPWVLYVAARGCSEASSAIIDLRELVATIEIQPRL